MAAVLYLQYYGLYLFAATVIVGSAVAVRRRAWPQLRATCLYGGACAVLFAPWVPQFLYQLSNTGAPSAPRPAVLDFFGDSFNALASAAWAAVVIALVIAVLSRKRRPPPDATVTVPGTPALSPGVPALALFTAVTLVTLVIAWLVGQVVNSWAPRYLGIVVVPALVPLAGGLARSRRSMGLSGLTVLALAGTSVPVLADRTVTVDTSKSDVATWRQSSPPSCSPGALVISPEVTDTRSSPSTLALNTTTPPRSARWPTRWWSTGPT